MLNNILYVVDGIFYIHRPYTTLNSHVSVSNIRAYIYIYIYIYIFCDKRVGFVGS
jgi:hypothetical protein